MTKSRVTAINLSNYTWEKSNGYVSIDFEGGSTTLKLNLEDAERLMVVAYEIVERRRSQMVEAVQNIQFPPLLGYDNEKTIEAVPPSSDDEILS